MPATDANSSGSFTNLIEAMRKEERLNAVLPVRVSSVDKGSAAEWSCTYEVSRRGARITWVKGITETDQNVWLQRNNQRAKYRVSWIGQPGTEHQNQVGLELLEMENCIWDDPIRKRLL